MLVNKCIDPTNHSNHFHMVFERIIFLVNSCKQKFGSKDKADVKNTRLKRMFDLEHYTNSFAHIKKNS